MGVEKAPVCVILGVEKAPVCVILGLEKAPVCVILVVCGSREGSCLCDTGCLWE